MRIFEYQTRQVRYDLLSELTWKKKRTIQMFFSRNKIDILNSSDWLFYFNKFK